MHTTPFKHPLATHAAGTVLGRRRNGSPIYAIAGGAGEGENGNGSGGAEGGTGDGGQGSGQDGSSGGSGGQGQAGQGAGQGGQQSGQGSGQSGSDAGKDGKDDPAATIARLQKELTAANNESAKNRTAAKQQAADEAVKALTEKLGKALGLVKEDGPPNPEQLTAALAAKDTTIAEKDATIRAKDVELAVYGRAEKAGAKAAALLDSRSFLRAIKDLDPTATGFGAALDDAIKKAVKGNAAYSTSTAGRSGGEQGGSSGEGAARSRPTSIGAALRSTYNT